MNIWSAGLVYWMLENVKLKETTAMIVPHTMDIQSFACSVVRRRVPLGTLGLKQQTTLANLR